MKRISTVLIKNYAESPLTDKIFTAPKTNNLIRWWIKLRLQAEQGNQEPLLFFKYNRSPIFAVFEKIPKETTRQWLSIEWLDCFVMLADEWLKKNRVYKWRLVLKIEYQIRKQRL